MLKNYYNWSLWLVAFCVLGLFFYFVTKEQLYMDKDFQYRANILSFDNFYDAKSRKYTGRILSNTRFHYQTVEEKEDVYTVKNVFDVRKPTGEAIFSVSRNYGINRSTGRHVSGFGDKDRHGYLFGPQEADKSPFVYWHINYDVPATMTFEKEEIIDGLKIYKYMSNYRADQTQNLHFLPGVPDSLGIELDINLNLWIEPVSGRMIKYEDYTTAYYYQLESKKRLYPWNRFHNKFEQISIDQNIQSAKLYLEQYYWEHYHIPGGIVAIIILILLFGYREQKNAKWRTMLIVGIVGGLGGVTTLLIYGYLLTSAKVKKGNDFNEDCNAVRLILQKEIYNGLELLYAFKTHFEEMKTFEYAEFISYANKMLIRDPSVNAVEWFPKITEEQRDSFEKSHHINLSPSRKNIYFTLLYTSDPTEQNRIGTELKRDSALTQDLLLSELNRQYVVSSVFKKDRYPSENLIKIFIPARIQTGRTGFFAIEISVPKIVEESIHISNVSSKLLIKIFDEKEQLVSFSKLRASGEFMKKSSLQVANRLWEIHFISFPEYKPFTKNVDITAVLISGFFLTLLMCSFLYKLLTDNRKELVALNHELNAYAKQLGDKNKELEQFTYIASHDLQEPLRTIINFIRLIEMQYQNLFDEKGKKYLEFISDAGSHMQNLVKTLLDYSRIGKSDAMMEIDCNTLLKDVQLQLHALIEESGTQIRVEPLPKVMGMRTELMQLFQNLVHNAIKFRKKDKPVTISIRATNEDENWHFSVQDDGIGIPEKYFEKIFVIFRKLHSRKEYEGAGIGLANCKKIVEIHGGSLWLDSQEGVGTTFHFTIGKKYVKTS